MQATGSLSPEDAIDALCKLFGVSREQWDALVVDNAWYVGDSRLSGREQIEILWNQRFASTTGAWLNEDSWCSPLWELWLRTPRMVCSANLEHLLRMAGRGSPTRLARATNRPSQTVSRWVRWRQDGDSVRLPPKTIRPAVLSFFGLPADLDLEREVLFLAKDELRESILRSEGRHYLESLRGPFLEQAVRRLREESNRQVSLRG